MRILPVFKFQWISADDGPAIYFGVAAHFVWWLAGAALFVWRVFA